MSNALLTSIALHSFLHITKIFIHISYPTKDMFRSSALDALSSSVLNDDTV